PAGAGAAAALAGVVLAGAGRHPRPGAGAGLAAGGPGAALPAAGGGVLLAAVPRQRAVVDHGQLALGALQPGPAAAAGTLPAVAVPLLPGDGGLRSRLRRPAVLRHRRRHPASGSGRRRGLGDAAAGLRPAALPRRLAARPRPAPRARPGPG